MRIKTHYIYGVHMNSREAAIHAARTLEENKAEKIAVLDLRKVSPVTNYFVIASVTNQRHMTSLIKTLNTDLKKSGWLHHGVEGHADGRWTLIDYDFLVVHIFTPEARDFYDLEFLWADATRTRWRKPAKKTKNKSTGKK